MSAIRLTEKRVAKVWGRRDLRAPFGTVPDNEEPVGEIWFEDPRGKHPALLVKYLFTSEKLSIQVHPDDAVARAHGQRCGKDEAWVILSADPEAVIGLGLCRSIEREQLRAAALDGSLEDLVVWRPVAAGESYYSPAGTIHSIGPGLRLIEIQQNIDLTYRLYDFGRPRELHLDEAVEAARPEPYRSPNIAIQRGARRTILASGGKFVLERWSGPRSLPLLASSAEPLWLILIAGGARLDAAPVEPGAVWLIEGEVQLDTGSDCDLLIAYAGGEVRHDFDAA